MEALAHTLSQLHDVFDLIPDFLHDLLVGLMLLIDLIDRALLTQVLVALYNKEGDLSQPALGAELRGLCRLSRLLYRLLLLPRFLRHLQKYLLDLLGAGDNLAILRGGLQLDLRGVASGPFPLLRRLRGR